MGTVASIRVAVIAVNDIFRVDLPPPHHIPLESVIRVRVFRFRRPPFSTLCAVTFPVSLWSARDRIVRVAVIILHYQPVGNEQTTFANDFEQSARKTSNVNTSAFTEIKQVENDPTTSRLRTGYRFSKSRRRRRRLPDNREPFIATFL